MSKETLQNVVDFFSCCDEYSVKLPEMPINVFHGDLSDRQCLEIMNKKRAGLSTLDIVRDMVEVDFERFGLYEISEEKRLKAGDPKHPRLKAWCFLRRLVANLYRDKSEK